MTDGELKECIAVLKDIEFPPERAAINKLVSAATLAISQDRILLGKVSYLENQLLRAKLAEQAIIEKYNEITKKDKKSLWKTLFKR